MPHIAAEKQFVCQPTKRTKGSFKLKHVDHTSASIIRIKFMQVLNFLENSLDLLIDEAAWSLILSNLRCQILTNTKMPGLPGHCIPQFHQTAHHTRYGSLLCMRHGVLM